MKQEHIGSNFDDFLKQDGLLAKCEAGALKRVVAWQIEREMKRRKFSRAKLASRIDEFILGRKRCRSAAVIRVHYAGV